MKSISKKNKYGFLKYLFWLGLILSIIGISARIFGGEWSLVAGGLFITGISLIGLWVIFLGSLTPGFWGRRSTQVGTNAVVATVALLVILGLINFLAVRYSQRIDLTENQLFTLSPMTQRVVKSLPQKAKIWIFSPNPNPSDVELLKNYRRYNPNLSYQFVDPQQNPGLTQKFKLQSLGQVFLEYGNEQRFVQTVSDREQLSETKLTNSIEQLTSDRIDKVYFLQGHGERSLEEVEGGLSQALGVLKDRNFTSLPLNLAERTEVPKDASVVVVAGPKRPLFASEAEALKNYLANGGSVLLMIDPETNPGVDNILENWGVKLNRQIVIDASGQGRLLGYGPATPLVTNYGNHPITKDFRNSYSFYPGAQPIEVTPQEGITETPLLLTNEQSWAESQPEQEPLQFDPNSGDRPGPLTLGVALTRKTQPSSTSPSPQATASPGTSPSPSPSPSPQATASPGTSPSPSPSPSPQATTSPGTSPSPSPSPSSQATTSPGTSPSPSPSPSPQATASPGTSPSPSPSPSPQATASPGTSPSPSPQATTSPTPEGKTDSRKSQPRLVVIGNSSFSTNGLFEQQLNGDMFVNSISWLSKRDDQTLSIRPREPKNRRIQLTEAQAGVLSGTSLFIVPLLGLMTAGVIWWRRR